LAATLSVPAITRGLRVPPATVGDYVRRAEVARPGEPVPESVDRHRSSGRPQTPIFPVESGLQPARDVDRDSGPSR